MRKGLRGAGVILPTILLASLTLAPRALAVPASVSLSSRIGSPTTKVTVTGAGFGHSQSLRVRFDAILLSTATTDSAGSFSAQVRIPGSATPGAHSVQVRGQAGSHILAEATFLVRTDWRQYKFDPQRDGYNPYENVLSPANVSELTPVWVASKLPSYVKSSVAVAGGRVFLPVYTDFFAFDATTGHQDWDSYIDYEPGAAPAVLGRTVYSSGIDTIWAYDGATGATKWTSFVGQIPYTDPLVVESTIYVSAYNYLRVDALDAATGDVLWRASTTGRVEVSLASAGNNVIAIDDQSRVTAYDAATGARQWTRHLGASQSPATPAVSGGTIYIRTSLHLVALDASTGHTLWGEPITLSVYPTSPAVANGVVYVGSDSGFLTAYDASTGLKLWATPIENGSQSPPVVANGVVYVGATSSVDALDASTGELLWTGATDGPVGVAPVVVNGFVYVGTAPLFQGSLYAFGLPNR